MSSKYRITSTCKRYLLRVAVALCIIVLLRPLLNKLFVKILNALPIEFGEFYVDIVIVVLTILGVVFIPLGWLEKYKNTLLIIWGFGIFVQLLDYFFWEEWVYTPTSFSAISYVVYFLYIYPILFMIRCIVEKAHFIDVDGAKKEGLYDAFNYRVHANRLLDFIIKRKSEDSYVIGVNAMWGDGKTFFIDLFKEELKKKDSQSSFIVVNFKPWFSHSPLDIINDFFTVFGETLNKEGIQLQSDLEKYKEALMGVEIDEQLVNQLFKSIKGLFDNTPNSSSLLYERINDILENEQRKIMVVIDDLDRLTKEELFEVIKLVRNSGSLKNTFFILAYDRKYLEKALESLQIGNHTQYLEKIVQMELLLPMLTSTQYEEYMYLYLERQYENTDYVHRIKDLLASIQSFNPKITLFNKEYCNIRYVESFIHKLLYNFQSISTEVVLGDYFLLNLIKDERNFNFKSFFDLVLKYDDFHVLKDKIVGISEDNLRVIELFNILCLMSASSSKSFLASTERRLTYFNSFDGLNSYISENLFVELLGIKKSDENNIENNVQKLCKLIDHNSSFRKDFMMYKIFSLSEYKKLFGSNYEVAGKNILEVFITILNKHYKEYCDSFYQSDNGRIMYFLTRDLVGLFDVDRNYIKEKLFNGSNANPYQSLFIGSILRGTSPILTLKDMSFLLSEEEMVKINCRYFKLATRDNNFNFEAKMRFYWNIRGADLDNDYGFYDKAKEIFYQLFLNNIEEFCNYADIKKNESDIDIFDFFGSEKLFIELIKENNLENNKRIDKYLSKR